MTKEEVIITAVQWWSDKLRGRLRHDNGDDSRSSILACMFADMAASPVNEEQLRIFEKCLAARLETRYDQYIKGQTYGSYTLHCDYGPDVVLWESAKEAGIPNVNFPFKTGMRIRKDHVEVSDGYGKPYVRI